jgi:hypothetical protein
MRTPPRFVLSRLSRDLYIRFLAQAKRRGFSFVQFRDFLSPSALPERYIALRHDIDFAPHHSLEMAEIEHAAGVASTFHVLVDGQFYNPLQPGVIRQLRRIHELGHEIGLHFAVGNAVHDDIGEEVAFRLQILNTLIGAPVRSFSQHDVVSGKVVSEERQASGRCEIAPRTVRNAPSPVRNRTTIGAKCTITGAKSHHERCEIAPRTVRNAASLVRNRSVIGAKSHHRRCGSVPSGALACDPGNAVTSASRV